MKKKTNMLFAVVLLCALVICFSACNTKNNSGNATNGEMSEKGKLILEGLIDVLETFDNGSEISVTKVTLTPVNFLSERVSVMLSIPVVATDGTTSYNWRLVNFYIEIANKMDATASQPEVTVEQLNAALKEYWSNNN